MAQDGQIITLDVDDGKLRQILTDPSGGPATFGSWLDIFGINGFNVSPEFTEKELAGDATTIDQYSKLKKLTGSFNCQVKFDVLEVLLGATASYTGSTPNEKATLLLSSSDLPLYFELDVRSSYRGGSDAADGDFHLRVAKAKMTKFTYTMASEEYATLQIDWAGVARLADGYFMYMEENETAITIAAGAADTTAPTVVTTVPADNATGIVVSANLTVEFSENIQFAVRDYLLTTQAGVAVSLSSSNFSYDSGTFVVTINPTSSLSASTAYLLTIQGVLDTAGNMLAAPTVVSFTTA